MEMFVRAVDAGYIPQIWPKVEAYLEAALTKGDDAPEWSACYNIHHVQSFVTSGQWVLLVAIDAEGEIHGAATISLTTYPLHRVAFITLIGGRMIATAENFTQLKALLKNYGATKINGFGRPSIVRLWKRYGFEPRITLMDVQI